LLPYRLERVRTFSQRSVLTPTHTSTKNPRKRLRSKIKGEQQTTPEGGDSPTDNQNKDGGYRGRGRGGGRGGYRGNKPNNYYFRKHNTDEEGFTVVKDEENHNSHYPSRRHQNATRGGYRGGRGGQYKEGEGQRGDRGGRGGRPWTAKEHRNQGEVRKPEFEQTVENNGPKSDAQ